MQRLAFLSAVIGLSLLCSGPEVGAATQVRRVLIRTYQFSVLPMPGWRTGTDKDGMPIFVNFPWSKMQPQLRLPKGGAIVNLVAWDSLLRRHGDESLTGWAHLDAVNAEPGTVISQNVDALPPAEIAEAILLSFDEATFGPNDQQQHEMNAYWTFRLKKFSDHLSYIVGDPRGREYEDALRHLVLSVRPL